MTITPVLLCGGSGTRLWPLSRRSFPKQFAQIVGTESLFQSSAGRLRGVNYASPVIVTGSDFRFIVTEQLAAMGIDPGAILIEPSARNTAPAVLAAALHVAETDPTGLILVAPSDHSVPNAQAFRDAVERGVAAAEAGQIVTFGITPDRAETGYGWLELGVSEAPAGNPVPLRRFVEKPNVEKANSMLAEGNYLWNAGIFLFRADVIVKSFREYSPDLVDPVMQSLHHGKTDLGFIRLDPVNWDRADDISIDYAVMERASNLSVVPFSDGWSDLGSWGSVRLEMETDLTGVATSGQVTAIDCTDSLLRSEHDGLELVGIGLHDIVAIAMPDAVLIADRSRASDAKLAVAALKIKGAKQAEEFSRDHRPWGWFETLALADRFQVKRIVVHPGAALSLQSHMHRAEHWVVVSGTARVTVDKEVKLIAENQSIYVPLGAIHRMENPGKVPMVLIEVQTGSYLGEDDIIRYEDVYARGGGAKG